MAFSTFIPLDNSPHEQKVTKWVAVCILFALPGWCALVMRLNLLDPKHQMSQAGSLGVEEYNSPEWQNGPKWARSAQNAIHSTIQGTKDTKWVTCMVLLRRQVVEQGVKGGSGGERGSLADRWMSELCGLRWGVWSLASSDLLGPLTWPSTGSCTGDFYCMGQSLITVQQDWAACTFHPLRK